MQALSLEMLANAPADPGDHLWNHGQRPEAVLRFRTDKVAKSVQRTRCSTSPTSSATSPSSLIAWAMPRTVFDVPALNARQQDLEQLAAQPDFWDDQQNAQKQMRRLDEVKAQLLQLTTWQGAVSDAQATLELYDLEPDDDMLAEAQAGLDQLRRDLDRWELERLLSGQYDKEGAVLSINAGAGGTDAQDWAQMLLRMYTRWAEDHDMKVTVDELSEGEEAGIKSATIEIEGRYAYGYLRNEKGTHRLVRISPFNANDKRQTSFAGIEVMPNSKRKSTSTSLKKTLKSPQAAQAELVVRTSTRWRQRCASCTSPQDWLCAAHRSAPSCRTRKRRWPCSRPSCW